MPGHDSSSKPPASDAVPDPRLARLRQEFAALRRERNKQKRGKLFESFLTQLSEAFNVPAIEPFERKGEQIDGAIRLDQRTFLIEAKWQSKKSDPAELNHLRGKIARRPHVAGIFISIAGFTKGAVTGETDGRQPVLFLLDGADLQAVVDAKIPWDVLLRAKQLSLELAVKVLTPVDEILSSERALALAQRPLVVTSPSLDRLHQLRPPIADFTGREAEIADLLKHIGQGVTISGVQGMGGIGKTELAYALADRLKGQFPDAQLYLDLKGTSPTPLPTTEVLSFVIRCFNPDEKLPDDLAQLQALFRSVLSDKRVLLLMDNAADRAQLEPLCPPPSASLLLVTSRKHFTLPGLHARNLDTLPPDQARDLLLKICPRLADVAADVPSADPNRDRQGAAPDPNRDRQGADPPADQIARLCGYLPLALRAAASALAERVTLTPADYIRRLTDEQRRMHELDVVTASLALSADLLSADLRPRWYMLAVFPADFDVAAPAAVWEAEPDDAQDALDALHRYSVLDWNPETRRFRLHDLARTFVRARLSQAVPPNDELAAVRRFVEHYAAVASAANQIVKQKDGYAVGLARFDAEWPNIQAAFAIAAPRGEDHAWANQAVMQLAAGCVYCLDLRLHGQAKIRWFTDGLEAARRAENRQAEGALLGNLGSAHAPLGDARKAIEFYKQSLAIAREIGDRRTEANALGGLALCHAALGDTHQGIQFHEQHIAIARAIGDRRAEGSALCNLGVARASLGDAAQAIGCFQQALAIGREVGDRRAEGNALGNLGNAHAMLGDARQAITFDTQALAISQELGDRRAEGQDLANLGSAYLALGDARKAIELYEQRLLIAREIADRAGEGIALGNLGSAHAVLGDPRQAIHFFETSLVIGREIGDRAGEARASWNMGLAYEKLGDLARAADLMQVAVDFEREIGHADAEKDAATLAALRARLK